MKTKKPAAKQPKKEVAAKQPKQPRGAKVINVKDLGNVHKALFGFQRENLKLPRNGHGNVNGKSYSYVTLDDLIDGVRPSLEKHDLVFTQAVTGDKLITTLVHAPSGTKVESDIDLGRPSNMQDYGSRITYARRYALTAMLGINAEQDLDATGSTEKPAPALANTTGGATATTPGVSAQQEAPFPDNIQPKAETPATPVATPEPMSTKMSDAFVKANAAIQTAYSTEALDMIAGQIDKSQRLTTDEKEQLAVILGARKDVITFDKQ